VHFDTNAARPLRAWIYGVNANLPTSVSITWSRAVNDDFSARFSAISRRYLYLIDVSELRHALFANAITRDRRHHLDPDLMGEAGQALVGEHDFSSFRSAHCQSRSPVRTINRLTVTRRGDVVALDIAANAFLHHMVRNVAGVLMDIGAGEQPKDWTRDLLKARDRTVASVTAPPEGLYLIDVNYPPMHALPTGPALPRLLSLLDL
jgi:tRNA pseudouridine38-40 synthase